jgi:Rieske Fe-S protein
MKNTPVTRREFFTTAGKTAAAAIVVGPMIVNQLSASSRTPPATMMPISLNLSDPQYSDLTTVGGSTKIPNPLDAKNPIIVTRISETACAAFSSRCPHFGCEVSLPENNVIVCPCHKSKFDMSGKFLSGPAKKSLTDFLVTLTGTMLLIQEKKA